MRNQQKGSCKIIIAIQLSVNVCSKIRTGEKWALRTKLPEGAGGGRGNPIKKNRGARHTFQGLKNKTVHIHVPLGVPLGAFSLKKATVGTFAVAFRVSSRAKYDEKNTCCFRIGIS